MRLNLSNNASTVLQSDISSNDTIITVDNTETLPEVPFPLTLNMTEEIVYVTKVDGNKLTVERGQEGTESKAYPSGTECWVNFTAGAYKGLDKGLTDVKEEVTSHKADIATENELGHVRVDGDSIFITDDGVIRSKGTKIIEESFTVTVGQDGDYQTLNEALQDLSKYRPLYSEDTIKVTIILLNDYEMREQVIVERINLSWIEITSEQAEVNVVREDMVKETQLPDGTLIYPVFCARDNGHLPIVNCLFYVDETGEENSVKGIVCLNNSKAIIKDKAGIKNAYDNIYAHSESNIEAYGCVATFAKKRGIYSLRSSSINAINADASNAGSHGIHATHSSSINASNADASNAGSYGIYANQSSSIEFWGGDASGAKTTGIRANQNSTINATNALAKLGEEDSPNDIYVAIGSTVVIYGTTEGGTSQAMNKVTSSGIIFG